MTRKFQRRAILKSGLLKGAALWGASSVPLSALAASASAQSVSSRIVRADVFAVPMPLVKPFRQAKGVVTHSDNVYVRLADEQGREGWGEAYNIAFLYGRGQPEIFRALTDYLLPVIKGHRPIEFIGLMDRLDSALPGNRDAKCAIDMALLDLLGKQLHTPVYAILGGEPADDIPMIGALPIDTPDKVAGVARKQVKQGYRHLKLKLGTPDDWQADVDRVLATRDAVGNAVSLVADANAIYDRRTAQQVLNGIRSARLDHFEQPINRYDIEGMATLAAKSDTPIAADESLQTLQDAARIARANAASAYILKLIKQGGLYRARQVAHFCQSVGAPVHISGGTELSCGRAAMLHLYTSLPNVAGAVEVVDVLGEDFAHKKLPFTPLTRVPTDPGLGVTIDRDKMERFITQKSSVS